MSTDLAPSLKSRDPANLSVPEGSVTTVLTSQLFKFNKKDFYNSRIKRRQSLNIHRSRSAYSET